jgi:hypothetical protein
MVAGAIKRIERFPDFQPPYTASGDYRESRFRKSRVAGKACQSETKKSPAAMAGLFVFRAPQLVG